VSFKRIFKTVSFKEKFLLKKICLKAVTIQYLPMGGGRHGAEILNRHRFQTIFLKDTFFKRYFKKVFLKNNIF